MNIEISEKQYAGIKSVAERMSISPTELVLRSVKACTSMLDLFVNTKIFQEEKQETVPSQQGT